MSETLKISTGSFGTSISNKRELVKYDNPILKTPTKEWCFKSPPTNAFQLGTEIVECMQEHNGLGLASPQIGLSHRMFVMGMDKNIVLFINPKILEKSKETQLLEEGCLSFPGLRLMIRRSTKIHVSYQDFNGMHHENKFEGLTARIFSHEYDHLDGILFTSLCSKLKLEMAIQKANKTNNFYKIKELI